MKHLSISKWLRQLGLPQYCTLFDEEYDGVEDLLHLTEMDLLELGVHSRLHRIHILSSIQVLQERETKRELRMMAEGKFASLPRNLHMSHQCTLASSMDLLSSGMKEVPSTSYQGVSIHGTLPRKKKGVATHSRAWEMCGSLPHPTRCRLPSSPLIHNIIEENQPFQTRRQDYTSQRDAGGMDTTMEYVKFSRDKHIMDGASEKLRRELEEELKQCGEEPHSHAWYHGAIPRQVAENLVQRDGDFLIRDSLSSPGNYVLTCQWKNSPQHFKINKRVVVMNEAYSRVQYLFEKEGFDSIPALVRYYVGNREPVSEVVGAIIFQPINRTLPLRSLEEKYGVGSVRAESGHREKKNQSSKRLSLNITNGQVPDHTHGRGNLLSNRDKCGSQPACLNHVQERRRPLKTHQSESFLPLGSRPQAQIHHMEAQSSPKSPVFRTGSEPALSPTVPRKMAFETQAGEAIRGSDSQLCPKPPPKPSKVPSMRHPQSPFVSPGHPAKPQKHWPFNPQQSVSPVSPDVNYYELSPCSPSEWEMIGTSNGYVDRLNVEEKRISGGSTKLDRSSYHNAIEALQNSSDEEDKKQEEKQRQVRHSNAKKARGFQRPVFEMVSAFRPGEAEFRLLPSENKPLEMSVLKRAKELLVSQDPKIIAKHILQADCEVARILNVSDQIKCQMGVTSGLELITLPHGRQLRQDLMERHNTMAIGVAVDILGCTGSLEERAATLNRIILVAQELKDSMGDLYAFSSIMKALDMPQITRLDHTWTALRRNYTHTAILYEKSLKPFYKGLYDGNAEVPLSRATVPLLMPLLTLMERPVAAFEGMELWESNDQGCEIMLRHLEEARAVSRNADTYTYNAKRVLQDFSPNEDMLEILKTDFQLRLLWGSRGAGVNQTERHDKFKLILTALSRKLEPPVKQTEL
ncbi:breast cancer anti-estrogen resistance protein 3 isoform X1 [Tachysurus fulvidraco]|uniref:breast cancer anti-estrogen resistance protein 3 isoform X1 n=2 Tax=Tachysurus fulvidraco TaxID=1234273 RepID=UPI001FEEE135|nr:breast cancer anti-estrogen resistance protein 3 isoform X1 [Tachysurus fulvidraco]XP_027022323.2 breast cancer anti-estrogen resistance protein 3 isoform X1 [Tachysurus fulvidraco]